MTQTEPITWHEGDVRFELESPPRALAALLQAAYGIALATPESGGRTRALEVLAAGGVHAVELGLLILKETIGGRVHDPYHPRDDGHQPV